MKKLTAADARKMYQKRFYATATHVAKMLCHNLDKELRTRCATDERNCAIHTFQIECLYPSSDYIVPTGLLEWRHVTPRNSQNSVKLMNQIVTLVQDHFPGWEVRLLYPLSDSDFGSNSLVFDAQYEAEEACAHQPEDFDAQFEKRICEMIHYFVSTIRTRINESFGTQSSQELMSSSTMEFNATKFSLRKMDGERIFREVKEALRGDGWEIGIITDVKNPCEELYPNGKYKFLICAIAK